MRRIFLIRHCAPDFPAGEKLCIADTDIPLSPEGLAQAACLPPRDATLFSSPMLRCVQTARTLGQPVQILEEFREMGVGEWEGLSFDQIKRQYPGLYAARGKDPSLLPPGGEEPRQALERFHRGLALALSQAQGDLAVITHGGILSVFLEDITGTRYKPAYGETVTLCWENGKLQKI